MTEEKTTIYDSKGTPVNTHHDISSSTKSVELSGEEKLKLILDEYMPGETDPLKKDLFMQGLLHMVIESLCATKEALKL